MGSDEVVLQRYRYLMRNYISRKMLEYGLDIESFVEMEADRIKQYVQVNVLAARETVCVDGGPDGRWQMLRCLLGLKYRRKMVTVDGRVMFPWLKCAHNYSTVLRLDVNDSANAG